MANGFGVEFMLSTRWIAVEQRRPGAPLASSASAGNSHPRKRLTPINCPGAASQVVSRRGMGVGNSSGAARLADRPYCHRGIFFSCAMVFDAFGTSHQAARIAPALRDGRTTANSMCCQASAVLTSLVALALVMLRLVIEAILFRASGGVAKPWTGGVRTG